MLYQCSERTIERPLSLNISLSDKSDYRTMNTNINTHHLAKVGGPETKESFAVIKRDRGALHSIKMGLATAVLFASVGMATAQQRYPAGANHAPAFSRSDHIRYDHSGTRGREGLGAIPRCSISRRKAGPCHYEYRRNGVLD